MSYSTCLHEAARFRVEKSVSVLWTKKYLPPHCNYKGSSGSTRLALGYWLAVRAPALPNYHCWALWTRSFILSAKPNWIDPHMRVGKKKNLLMQIWQELISAWNFIVHYAMKPSPIRLKGINTALVLLIRHVANVLHYTSIIHYTRRSEWIGVFGNLGCALFELLKIILLQNLSYRSSCILTKSLIKTVPNSNEQIDP